MGVTTFPVGNNDIRRISLRSSFSCRHVCYSFYWTNNEIYDLLITFGLHADRHNSTFLCFDVHIISTRPDIF